MKTKEEILDSYKPYLDLVATIGLTREDVLKAMQEYAELYHAQLLITEPAEVREEDQTLREHINMKNGSFMQIGCIDSKRDLWANINCQNHIDPATCKRETSCIKCERFTANIHQSLSQVSQVTDEEIEKWAMDQWAVQTLFNYKGDGADLITMGAKAHRDGKINKG